MEYIQTAQAAISTELRNANYLGDYSAKIIDFCNTLAPPASVMAKVDEAEVLFYGYLKEFAPAVYSTVQGSLESSQHPHSAEFPLMNPFHVLLITLSYIAIIIFGRATIGAIFPPIKPKFLQVLHNAFLVVLSAFMAVEALRQAFFVEGFGYYNNSIDDSPKGRGLARIIWIFYASKIVEFIDTFIMLIKQNFKQVSFLHVYHHATIYPIWWAVSYYGPGGDAYHCVVLNSFIHVIMYLYYMLSTMGIPMGAVKPLITSSQMAQFLTMLYVAGYNTFVKAPKNYPNWLFQLLFVYMLTLLALFGNFFVKSYLGNGKKKNKKNNKRK